MIPALLSDYLHSEFEVAMAEMMFAMPGVVTGISGSFEDLRVTAKIAINELYVDDTSAEHLEILSVPVLMQGGMNTMISYPVEVGDTVLLVFCQRSMDNFKIGNGQPTMPNDSRKFQAEDAVAIPGLYPFSRSLNRSAIRKFPHNARQDLVIAHNVSSGTEVMIQMKKNGDMVVNTAQDITWNCRTMNVNASQALNFTAPTTTLKTDVVHNGNYSQTGNYTMTGIATFNGIVFNTHKHTGVTPGTGTSAGPVA